MPDLKGGNMFRGGMITQVATAGLPGLQASAQLTIC